jgi:MFS family permease
VVVTVAVVVWGSAIAAFGLVPWLPLALVLLAVAGWADVVSALFRNMIIQFSTPDRMRGRLLGLQIGVVAGGPRLGDLEAGSVATLFGNQVSVVSGGLACVVGALALFRHNSEFRRLELRPGHRVADLEKRSRAEDSIIDEPFSDEAVAD